MNTKKYIPNIPEASSKRIVVIGGGFAGLKLVTSLIGKGYQIILIDKNNFHQFQPLLYQVATAGLEPSSISFPLRKILQNGSDVYFRIADFEEVIPGKNEIRTNIGYLSYDYLVLAMGVGTNYFGQKDIEKNVFPMKSASDAILIRNTILEDFETALLQTDEDELKKYLNIAIVGGGPTGVELAGALAEMKKYILPKDYPELDISKVRINLFEASPVLLAGMSASASENAAKYLDKLGVEYHLNTSVKNYDGTCLSLSDGSTLKSNTVIWAAGVAAKSVKGINPRVIDSKNRIKVDHFNRVSGHDNIFAIGDLSYMNTEKYPKGHPQVAQVAIQQAKHLAKNLKRLINGETELYPFEYSDKGSMATIGRNLAVADLPFFKMKGWFAWFLWSFVHLFAIVGVKNKIFTFLNWTWKYFTYDQSLRLLIRHKPSVSRDKTDSMRKAS